MSEINQPGAVARLNSSTTPHQTSMRPIKKDSSSGKKEQLMADRDAYLQLLLTQLKSQSPQNPADTNQMTQQIVAISQAEQTISMNENIEKLVQMEEAKERAALVNYIGKDVDYSEAVKALGIGNVQFSYGIQDDAERLKVKIINSSGEVVKTAGVDPAQRKSGVHTYEWDGRNNSGQRLPEGLYRIEIEAYKDTGSPMQAITTSRATVLGMVEELGKYNFILSNGNKIGLDEIQGIYLAQQQTTEATN
ncbi:MAG: flagellar hook assembly protein FlgD [Sphingobacteriia bacterium]|nr:flagellar hook assembly protein FlgD [Sphingobacteriia bacterium]